MNGEGVVSCSLRTTGVCISYKCRRGEENPSGDQLGIVSSAPYPESRTKNDAPHGKNKVAALGLDPRTAGFHQLVI